MHDMTSKQKPWPLARGAMNFWAHSGHIPLVLIILEALLSPTRYFTKIDPYLLLMAGAVQAVVAERWRERWVSGAHLANLIGPLVYSAAEVLLEGAAFFTLWHHQAYWGFAVCFTVLQAWQLRAGGFTPVLVVAESVLRSAIPLVTYALFEAISKEQPFRLAEFFADSAHEYLAIVLLLLGLLLGFSEVALRSAQARVLALTRQLHEYSVWALGEGILEKALGDNRTLALRRVERAVLFLDIRGFTAWSEQQTPEQVVSMLNRFYAVAEAAFIVQPIKLKYTADEVLAVCETAQGAIESAQAILRALQAELHPLGLSVGAGIHFGAVVEGVLGGAKSKAYDVIGDTVNTAQRLCDAAQPWEVLLSEPVLAAANYQAQMLRTIQVKGKKAALTVGVIACL